MKQDTLTIATYNIEAFRNPALIQKNILSLAKSGVTCFCIQEIVSPSVCKILLDALGKNWDMVQTSAHQIVKGKDMLVLDVAILWNKNMLTKVKVDEIILPKLEKKLLHEHMFAKLTGYTGKVRERRILLMTFLYKSKKITMCSVHVDVFGGARHRRKQVKYILEYVEKQHFPSPLLMAGDFNTTDIARNGSERKKLQQLFHAHDFLDITNHIRWTQDIYQSNFGRDNLLIKKMITRLHLHVHNKLDYIWSKNCEAIDVKRAEMRGSDHLPLVAVLRV